MLNGDDGIIYEMLNEPELPISQSNWQAYDVAMNATIDVIRKTGATNTLLADGLDYALSLSGLLPVTDPLGRVAYSVHPYYHAAYDETMPAWQTKFGTAARSVPVIAGEWSTLTGFYCDANTPTDALAMLAYMQSSNIGLVAVTYDEGLPSFGGIVSDYDGTPTTFANAIACGTSGFGPGTVIQNWYRSGMVPSTLE